MTFAQFIGNGSSGVVGVINTVLVPLIISLAFLVFIYGIVKYFFLNSGNETAREEGKQFALWGIIGMVLIFAIWGVINLLLSTLGIAPS